jgi:hypothetical protein
MSTSTAMVVSESRPEQHYQLVPRTFGEVLEWAEFIAASGLAPDGLNGNAKKVAIVLLSGMELAVAPMMAMRVLPVIKNKVSQSAEFMVARCLASSVCEYFTCLESTATKATYQAKRVGAPGPVTISYTMADAIAAGAGDMYKKHPAAMLRARASSHLARTVFPDVTGGMHSREELDDGQPEVNRPSPIIARPTAVAEPVEATRYAITPAGEAALEAEGEPAPHISQAAAVAPVAPVREVAGEDVGALAKEIAVATADDMPAIRARCEKVPEGPAKNDLRVLFSARREWLAKEAREADLAREAAQAEAREDAVRAGEP